MSEYPLSSQSGGHGHLEVYSEPSATGGGIATFEWDISDMHPLKRGRVRIQGRITVEMDERSEWVTAAFSEDTDKPIDALIDIIETTNVNIIRAVIVSFYSSNLHKK